MYYLFARDGLDRYNDKDFASARIAESRDVR